MNGWNHGRVAIDEHTGFDVWRLDSGQPGPRVVVLGGVHGDEVEGALAAGRITTMPLELGRGMLEVVPVCHEVAFAADSRTSPVDGGNLARVFPGDGGGNATERLAWHLTQRVLSGADLLIDLHTSGQSYDMPFLAGFRRDGSERDGLGERAAEAIGAEFLWHHPDRAAGRTLSVVDVGIYVECPGGGPTNMVYVERYTEGLLRAFDVAGILTTPAGPSCTSEPVRVAGGGDLDRDMATVTQNGVFLHAVQRGEGVAEGQLLGTLVDVRGVSLEEIRATTAGYVMALKRRSTVRSGDMVVLVAPETRG